MYRSGAIIVSSSFIKAVSLSELKHDEVANRMKELRTDTLPGARSTYTARNRKLQVLLQWLWDAAVESVCNELGLQPISDDSTLPQVWWIGVGQLAMAPPHAAGNHSLGSTKNIISRAVSSYISTTKALSYARERKLEPQDSKNPRVLLVTMPETPTYPPLRHTNDEAYMIASVGPGSTETTLLEMPSADDVLRELPSHQVVHFACHGIPDAEDPSKSGLLLLNNDPLSTGLELLDQLTVGRVSSRNMRGISAQIAYLSAFSTAVNGAEKLQDESIHIASGFQLAGFSHVLATLWNAQDTAAQSIAIEFYRLLFGNQANRVGHATVSYSFHHAVKLLREKKGNQPIPWAPFIHTGA